MKEGIEIPSNATRSDFDALMVTSKEGTAQPRTAPREDAIAETIVREIKEQIIAAVVRELHAAGGLAPQRIKAEATADVIAPDLARAIERITERSKR